MVYFFARGEGFGCAHSGKLFLCFRRSTGYWDTIHKVLESQPFTRTRTQWSRNVDVHGQQLLLELFSPGDHFSIPVDDNALAIEHKFVLTADGIGIGYDDIVLFCPRGKHLQAFFALSLVIGRCVDVRDDLSARQRLDARRAFIIPDIFADIDTHADTIDEEDRVPSSGAEVSVFVEHAVVRQEYLMIR